MCCQFEQSGHTCRYAPSKQQQILLDEVWHFRIQQKIRLSGGQVVSVLTFYHDGPSSNHAEVY